MLQLLQRAAAKVRGSLW